jgi:hypothetical protein
MQKTLIIGVQMTSISIAATAGYGNAIYHGNSQKTGNFDNFLQEQIKNISSAEPEIPENVSRWINLSNQFDLAEIEARNRGITGNFDDFDKDFELKAYVRQLALENGINPGGTLENPDHVGRARLREFNYQVWQLLDQGLISRQDVIDAVKFPPKVTINGDGGGITPDMDGFGKTNEYIKLTSPMELFEMLWGKEK